MLRFFWTGREYVAGVIEFYRVSIFKFSGVLVLIFKVVDLGIRVDLGGGFVFVWIFIVGFFEKG